jgi:hypothetical protein
MGLLGKITRYVARETVKSAKKTAKRALRKAGTHLFSSPAKSTRATTRKLATTTRKKVRR